MHDPAISVASGTKTGVVVVLLWPGELGSYGDPAALRETLASAATAMRVLLCLPSSDGVSLVSTLIAFGHDVEILAAPHVEVPRADAYVLHMSPGASLSDQIEFALALADIVVADTDVVAGQGALIRTARSQRKPIVVPGEHLPSFQAPDSVAHWLATNRPRWHAIERGVFGGAEQMFMELLAFNWRGLKEGGIQESAKRLWRCIGGRLPSGAYFAPEKWQALAPDLSALDLSSRIVACFDSMDRSALHGSYIHRGLTWISHLGAAFAVAAAVSGQLRQGSASWGIAELVALILVAVLVLTARHISLQDRWTACRLGAEQLRIARMSLPLFALPPALCTADIPPAGAGPGDTTSGLEQLALVEVKRAVRDQGLPRLRPALEPSQAVAWLQLIVTDQIGYHRGNFRKLECAEARLGFVTQAFFFLAVVAVVAHFTFHAEYLLLFTAAGPAVAAALHGTGIRLGIVHRAKLSRNVEKELIEVSTSLAKLIQAPPATETAWREVRRLASQAAASMGSENTSWHGLVRSYRDQLPA